MLVTFPNLRKGIVKRKWGKLFRSVWLKKTSPDGQPLQ